MRNPPQCRRCGNHPAKEKITNGTFKGYLRTCKSCFGYHHKPGPNHPNATKKGRREDREGYVHILDPRKAGTKTGSRYICEHRLVVEQSLGRRLRRNEIVHHANGIRNDNRLKNLILLGPKQPHESRTFTKALQARIRELETALIAARP